MEAPTPLATDKEKGISTTISIEQNNYKYPLHLNYIGDIINFALDYNSNNYTKQISLKEIKDRESKAIFLSHSSKDFIEYLKKLSEMKKLSLIKKDNFICIHFELEIMFIKHEIEIELLNKEKNIELIEKELEVLKINYNTLKKENQELKQRIENLETEMKQIKKFLNISPHKNRIKASFESDIMKESEFDLIHLAIKSRLNKEVKELKKLYQATVDGDGAYNFHSRCDNIPNTLVIIKSKGNRRFGGFNSERWSSPSKEEWKDDKNAFVFSLDKQKIYSYKNDGKAIYNSNDCGPFFGEPWDIGITQYCIQKKGLWTEQSALNCSYDYNGDKNALSEDGEGYYIFAADYEVFQVIFS